LTIRPFLGKLKFVPENAPEPPQAPAVPSLPKLTRKNLVKPCEAPDSLTEKRTLKFIRVTGPDDPAWDRLKEDCPIIATGKRGLAQIRKSLADFTRMIVVEPAYICKDHRNLFSNYYSKKFTWAHGVCSRLHFFSDANISPSSFLIGKKDVQNSYIGNCVIRPIPNQYLGRITIDPAKIGMGYSDEHYCLATTFTVNLYGHRLEVKAFPHLSQDTDVTVCGHAALWGICRYLSERYAKYPELLPFDLIARTPANHGRRFPYRGMVPEHYAAILDSFGCFPLLFATKLIGGYDRGLAAKNDGDSKRGRDELEREEFKDYYSYLESGFPILASVFVTSSGGNHAICLIGHTIDYNPNLEERGNYTEIPNWDKESEEKPVRVIDSSSFVKEFIVTDDNAFPYQLLGRTGNSYAEDEDLYDPPGFSIEDILSVVCPLPEKVYLTASRARKIMATLLGKFFVTRKSDFEFDISSEQIVTRLFVTTETALKCRKLENYRNNNKDGLLSFVLDIHFPHFIWVMEVATLENYKNGQANAEIIIDATSNKLDAKALYARIGKQIIFEDRNFNVTGEGKPHYPATFSQFCHNLGCPANVTHPVGDN